MSIENIDAMHMDAGSVVVFDEKNLSQLPPATAKLMKDYLAERGLVSGQEYVIKAVYKPVEYMPGNTVIFGIELEGKEAQLGCYLFNSERH